MAARQLPARRYFAVLALIIVGMYALIFLTGDSRTPQLGLDLQGGTTVTLTARTPNGTAPAPDDLELARQIIEQRVNGLGVAGAEVITQGSSNIVISVPGDNGEQARQLGATAQLRFRPVLQGPEAAAQASGSASSSASASASAAASGSGSASASASASGSAASATPSGSAAATSTSAAGSSAAPTSAAASTTAPGGAIPAEPSAPKPGSPAITQDQ